MRLYACKVMILLMVLGMVAGCGVVPSANKMTLGETIAELATEQATSATSELATEFIAESTVEQTTPERPETTDSFAESVAESTVELTTSALPEPTDAEAPSIEPTAELPTEPTAEVPTEPIEAPPTEPTTEVPAESIEAPSTKSTVESVTEPVEAPSVEPTETPIRARELLNVLTLHPKKTGCTELDALVEQILTEIIDSEMDNYEKTKACYDYLIENCSYGFSWCSIEFETMDYTQEQAYVILSTKVGVCDNYSAAFAVMMQALGLDVRKEMGWTALANNAGYTGHTWTVLEIDGVEYVFDPQVEDDIAKGGPIRDYRFCKEYRELPWKYVVKWTEADYLERAMRCNPDAVIAEMMRRMTDAGRESFDDVKRATFRVTLHYNSGATDEDILAQMWEVFGDRGAMNGHYVGIVWNGVDTEHGTHSFTMFSGEE
ncbi:MAG: hypothetical protein IJA58_07295 [Lachnospiraceae bacterium]|nr:hypothetical protein [Lachnospiraceae bacterium]